MSTINDSDLLLVERNGNLHQITYDQMSTLNDDDILLVERGGVQYKVEAQYVSTGPNGVILPSVEVLTPVNGAGLNEGDPYTPISSAYVSTDTTPITYRHFPELITTVSGGSWVDENKMFNGSQSYFSELTGAAGVVSQAVFTPQTGWTEAQTTVWAYVTTGGTVEVLDENDTVLRSYALLTSFQEVGNDIGIVRADQKIRFSTNNQNESLFISRISGAPTDYYINGRVAFEFADDTDLDKMVAPIIMTDENGDIKVPTTSTVDSTTVIPGEKKGVTLDFVGNGTEKIIASGPGINSAVVGDRMMWAKVDAGYSGVITDNVGLNSGYTSGQWLHTGSTSSGLSGGPVLNENDTTLPVGNSYNRQGASSHIVEIGVAPKVLDIVYYTGDGSSLYAVSHNLGCKPGMIIIKRIDSAASWVVWHKDLTPPENLFLNSDVGESNGGYFPSEPTKEAFYLGAVSTVNASNGQYVAYVFAADTPGKIKCGKYQGSGYSQGITTGFRPGFVLVKNIDQPGNWCLTTKTASAGYKHWYANVAQSLAGGSVGTTFYPNNIGFYMNGADPHYNNNNEDYIYLAVAEDLTGPSSTQLNLLSGQDLEFFPEGTPITSNLAASGSNISFASTPYSGNGSGSRDILPYIDGQYFFDTTYGTGNKYLFWVKSTTTSYKHVLYDSERAVDSYLSSNAANTGVVDSGSLKRGPLGVTVDHGPYMNQHGEDFVAWSFLGSPQFFDVQKYVGNGGTQNIQHDLGVEPGFIMIKKLGATTPWICHHHELGFDKTLTLNTSSGASNSATRLPGATDTYFTVGASGYTNAINQDFIAYIFAKDTPYVKCGKYTGTGQDGFAVDIGFKPRWMLIKSTTDQKWTILDKNLPNQYLMANQGDAADQLEHTFTSTGITIRNNLNTGKINTNGMECVYIAIADETEGHPPNFPSSSTVLEDPDVNSAVLKVNAESFDVGDSASAPALEASITTVAGSEGNKLFVDASTGTWMPGLYAKGSETTVSAPSADEITFTSQNQGTPAFSGVDATLASRTWTLESGPSATGPWTLVDSYVDYDVLNSQDGATPWTSNKPNLTPNTFYRIKVQYNSTNAESVESVYNTFKTGDA